MKGSKQQEQKWGEILFKVNSLGDTPRKAPGIFIFADEHNKAYYIGETEDLQTLKDHQHLTEAKTMGANYLHYFATADKSLRASIIQDLINNHQPDINKRDAQHRTEQTIEKVIIQESNININKSIDAKSYMIPDNSITNELSETESKLNLLFKYEKHYLELIKEYKEEIKFASCLQEDLRRERSQFFTQTLRDVVQTLQVEEIDKKVASQWIEDLVASYTKSIDLSSDLAKTHVVQVLNIFKEEAKKEVSNAKLDTISTALPTSFNTE